MSNQPDYVKLGLLCADVCTTLDRGLKGKNWANLSDSTRDTIDQLTT